MARFWKGSLARRINSVLLLYPTANIESSRVARYTVLNTIHLTGRLIDNCDIKLNRLRFSYCCSCRPLEGEGVIDRLGIESSQHLSAWLGINFAAGCAFRKVKQQLTAATVRCCFQNFKTVIVLKIHRSMGRVNTEKKTKLPHIQPDQAKFTWFSKTIPFASYT